MSNDKTVPRPPRGSMPARRRILWMFVLAVAIAAAVASSMSQKTLVVLSNPVPVESATAHDTETARTTKSSAVKAPVPVASSAAAIPTAPSATTAPPAGPTTEPIPGSIVPPAAIANEKISAPVKTAVAGFINEAGQIATDSPAAPTPGVPASAPAEVDFTAVAAGVALGELEAQHQEFASNGWQQSGTVTVVGTPAVTTQGQGADQRITVVVCLDSSAVQLVDNTGATVLKAEKAGTRKNLNNYVVQEVDGKWLVIDHSFPDDPHC